MTHRSQVVAKYRTWKNQLIIDHTFPFRTYWRVSARSLFSQRLGRYSDHITLSGPVDQPNESNSIKPAPLSVFLPASPASSKPMLTWTVVPGTVYYELELLSAPPENPNDTLPSVNQIFLSREVFTNGYNAILTNYKEKELFWRVRGLR